MISIQRVSQSAGRTRTKMARFALAKRRMRATQPVPDNRISFDRTPSRKKSTFLPLLLLNRNAIGRSRVNPQSESSIKGLSKVVSNLIRRRQRIDALAWLRDRLVDEKSSVRNLQVL